MPFRHKVDDKLDIVVLKGIGDVSVMDIISEIQEAISSRRGDGITRRLIDMTDQPFFFNLEDAKKILGLMKIQAKILKPRKIALVFKEIPESFDLEGIRSLLNSPTLKIGVFTDKSQAIRFLNA